MKDLSPLEKKLNRALLARKQAERILEEKALELFTVNQSLEATVTKRTEQLAESENKYRSIIENMELGLLEVSTEGIITKVYSRFCEMIGYSEEELLGANPLRKFVLPEFWGIINQQTQERENGNPGTYQVQLRKKDGEIIWVLISGAPYFDQTGELAGTLDIHYDITESVKLRSELQKAKIVAERARKAEQNFLANMSHEIRTPLNAVIGMSHLLRDTPLNENQIEYLDILLSSANVLQALIADILDISKIEAGKIDIQRKPIHLPEILNSVIKTFQIRLDSKPISFIQEIDMDIEHFILGDGLVLNQIFLNLLGNAEKFTEKGEIAFRAKVLSQDQKKIKIHFEVKDTGIGIDPKSIKMIFEEFKQANATITKKYGGTGLGLAITKKLISLLGGDIKVVSEVGIGSQFTFDIEFEKSKGLLSESKNVFSSAFHFDDIHKPVLIVEDNIMNQKYITKLIEKWGLEYDLAQNGREGWEKSKEKKYAVIFMDIQMPEMNGYEATREIRKEDNLNYETPIIALTASTLLSKKQEALDVGMSDYLSKPFDPNQLANLLSKYLKIETKPTPVENVPYTSTLDKAYLKMVYQDDNEYAKDIFETFLEITNEELVNLKDSITKEDYSAIYQVSHKIKPTFTMVGLERVSLQLAALEEAARNNNLKEVHRCYSDFDTNISSEMKLVKEELSQITKRIKT